jgi:hypothetical protein
MNHAELLQRAAQPDRDGLDWLTGLHAAQCARSAGWVARRLLRQPTDTPLALRMAAFHQARAFGRPWDIALLEALRETETDDPIVLNVVVPEVEAWYQYGEGRLDQGLAKGLAIWRQHGRTDLALHLLAVAVEAHDHGHTTTLHDPALPLDVVCHASAGDAQCCPLCAVELVGSGDCDLCGTDPSADAPLQLAWREALRWDQTCPSCQGPRHALALCCPRCRHRPGAPKALEKKPWTFSRDRLIPKLERNPISFYMVRRLATTWESVARQAHRHGGDPIYDEALRWAARMSAVRFLQSEGEHVDLIRGPTPLTKTPEAWTMDASHWFEAWSLCRAAGVKEAQALARLPWKTLAKQPADRFWKPVHAWVQTGDVAYLRDAKRLLDHATLHNQLAIDHLLRPQLDAWVSVEMGGPVDLRAAGQSHRALWSDQPPVAAMSVRLMAARAEAEARGLVVLADPSVPAGPTAVAPHTA